MNLAAVRKVRLEEAGGRGDSLLCLYHISPHRRCSEEAPWGSFNPRSSPEEIHFLYLVPCQNKVLEVTLDGREDARMSWGRDHQPHPYAPGRGINRKRD